jgi:hypothetical protein
LGIAVAFFYKIIFFSYASVFKKIKSRGQSLFSHGNLYMVTYQLYATAIYFYLIYATDILKTHPRLYLYFWGCAMAVASIRMLIARVARKPFNPYKSFCAVFYLAIFVNSFFQSSEKAGRGFNQANLIKWCLVLGCAELFHLFYNLIRQGCAILKIPFLS